MGFVFAHGSDRTAGIEGSQAISPLPEKVGAEQLMRGHLQTDCPARCGAFFSGLARIKHPVTSIEYPVSSTRRGGQEKRMKSWMSKIALEPYQRSKIVKIQDLIPGTLFV
jgi:hypothetical protein